MRLGKPVFRFYLGIALSVLLIMLSGCSTVGQSISNSRNASGIGDSYYEQRDRLLNNNRASVGDPDTAFKALPEMSNNDFERLGDTYFRNSNYPMALVNYENALKTDPENLRVLYKKGLLFLAARLNEDAERIFQAVIQKRPDFSGAHEGLGQALFQMKKFDKAESSFQRSIALNPKLWKAHNYLGNIYDYRGQYQNAEDEYFLAISCNPGEGLLYHNLGVSYFLAEKYEDAVGALCRAIERGWREPKTYNALGLALWKLGRHDEAFEEFKKAGDIGKAYNNVGVLYLADGRYDEAIRSFEMAVESSPTFYAKANENLRKAKPLLKERQ
ncbi:MAG: repeat-containing protein [Deltaproteobacteria bacterium]|nr:repeat-containing protein [Deltaproteobacteria bacterium]